jgi:dihydropyrimidinase
MLPLFWDEAVNRRKMSRAQAVRMLSTNAAQIAGLHPRKGTIRIGADADVVLFDPLGSWVVRSRDMLTEEPWSPLDDRELTGFVVRTLRRGVTIYDADRHDDDSLLAEGSGALLTRA